MRSIQNLYCSCQAGQSDAARDQGFPHHGENEAEPINTFSRPGHEGELTPSAVCAGEDSTGAATGSTGAVASVAVAVSTGETSAVVSTAVVTGVTGAMGSTGLAAGLGGLGAGFLAVSKIPLANSST